MKTKKILVFSLLAAACSSTAQHGPPPPRMEQFEPFTPARTAYRIIPGDQLNVNFYAVPSLNQTVTVGPDGRIKLPMARPVMVADMTLVEAQDFLMQVMSNSLVDPSLDISVASYAPQQVFVGGVVGNPGIVDMPGQIDILQAIIMAGGFTESSGMTQVILIRREPGGQIAHYSFDVREGIYNPEVARFGPLQRFDVIYVPRSRIAQQNLFVQQFIRNSLPISFSLYYDIAGNNR